MATADKLVYLDETKDLLREAINASGGALTELDPFREYVDPILWGWLVLAYGGLDLDYVSDRYRVFDPVYNALVEKPWADIVNNYSAPAGRTYFDSSGVLQTAAANTPIRAYDPATGGLLGNQIFGAATNLFINSNAPATQSISVTAQTYTLSIYGTGSVALSGASTGVLNGVATDQRQTLTFTPTAGSLTLTVSGAVVCPQLQTGAAATPYIQTAGSPVPIAAENQIIDGANFAGLWNPGEGAVFVEASTAGEPTRTMLAAGLGTGSTDFLRIAVTGTTVRVNSASTVLAHSGTSEPRRYCVGFSASGTNLYVEGLPPQSAATSPNTNLTQLSLGGSSHTPNEPLNGYIRRIVIFRRALPPSILARLVA